SDIRALSERFLARKHPGKRVEAEALARLTQHHWPGNVRELRNVVDRMALLADGEELRVEHLPLELGGIERKGDSVPPVEGAFSVSELRPLAQLEADYLRWAEARATDRVSLARALGVSERTLYRKLDEARR